MLNVNIYHDETPTIQIGGGLYDINPLPAQLITMVEGRVYGFNNEAHMFNGFVTDEKDCIKPGFYVLNGEIKVIDSGEEEEQLKFSMDDVKTLLAGLSESPLTDEDLRILSESNKAKTFTIRDEDSGIDKIIKTVINLKEIDPKIYKSKFDADHTIGNLISSLRGPSNMTTLMFSRWVDTLELNYQIKVWDSSEKNPFPMGKTIMYDSRTNDLVITDIEDDKTI